MSGKGGPPPDGHPRRCQAKNRARKQCARWALTTSNYCQFHGGRRATQIIVSPRFRVPSFYGKYLGPKLTERVRAALSKSHEEQITLYEELAVTRATACQALALAQPLWDPKLAGKLDVETKAAIMTTLAHAMDAVKDMVLAASKLEKEQSDKVSMKVVNLIVGQIIATINDVCGTENEDLATAITKAIDDRVRTPINDKISPNVEVDLS